MARISALLFLLISTLCIELSSSASLNVGV